jgi:hypothetical protein
MASKLKTYLTRLKQEKEEEVRNYNKKKAEIVKKTKPIKVISPKGEDIKTLKPNQI